MNIFYNENLKNENENWEYIVFHYLKSLIKKNDFAEMKKIIDFYKFDITFTKEKKYSLLWYASKKYNKEAFSFLVDNIINQKEGKHQIDSILDALFSFEIGAGNNDIDDIHDNSVHDNYPNCNTSNINSMNDINIGMDIEYDSESGLHQDNCCTCGSTF